MTFLWRRMLIWNLMWKEASGFFQKIMGMRSIYVGTVWRGRRMIVFCGI